MTAPTVNVTVKLSAEDGPAYAGVTVRARLDINEVYLGFVISDEATGVTDATGTAVLACFPNAPSPTGLGTQGSTYRFRAQIPGGRKLDVQARVPNSNCFLQDILVTDTPIAALDAASLAVLQAQAYTVQTAADRVQTGLDRVQTGLDKVATAADRVQTGLDRVATAADRVQTGLDRVSTTASALATAADRVQTGLDRTSSTASQVAANIAKLAAEAAASASGSVTFFDTKALATAGLAGIADQGIIEVVRDESLTGNPRTRYRKSGGVYVYKLTLSYGDADVITSGTTDTTTINVRRGSPANSIAAGDANTISGGGNTASPNLLTGTQDYRTISGGYDNVIQACVTSTITGGSHNRVNTPADHATISGSLNIINSGIDCTIGGGSGHTINGGNGVTIAGGSSHVVDAASNNATIAGGSTNTVKSRWATIGGGINNTAKGDQSVVAGGNGNYARDGAVIGGGYQNLAGSVSFMCDSAVIAGGYQHSLGQTANAQYSSIGGGFQNTINVNYSTIPGGIGNVVSGIFGTAWGQRAKAYNYGQTAWTSGMFATAGDCQASSMVARRTTTTATQADLLLDGGGPVIAMPLNTVWGFRILVAAGRTDGTPGSDYCSFEFAGMAVVGATAGTIALQGLSKVINYRTDATMDCTVQVFSGFLRVLVTGAAGKTMRWVSRIELVEVGFA